MASVQASLRAARPRAAQAANIASNRPERDQTHRGRCEPNGNENGECGATDFKSVTMVMVEVIEPLAGGVTGLGEAVNEASPGVPAKAKLTGELNAFSEVTVATTVVVSPALMVSEEGEIETVNAVTGTVPVPVMGTSWGEVTLLSATLRFADSAAWVVGVKVTLMVQLAPAARVPLGEPQVFVCEKSEAFVPVNEMVMVVRDPVPLLVKVTGCERLEVFSD